ncbi:MAG: BlaI/MecI/CopY family transcriptional regulator [Thermoleophilia bacterium]
MVARRNKKTRPVQLRTSASGVKQVLGDLEADIMEYCWQKHPCSVKDVHAALANEREIAYTTVMTVMSRLAEKGILERQQEGRAYLYTPTQSREGFCSETVTNVMSGLIDGFGEPALSHFVDTIDSIDPGKLDELMRLIEAKKGRNGKSAT